MDEPLGRLETAAKLAALDMCVPRQVSHPLHHRHVAGGRLDDLPQHDSELRTREGRG